MTTNFKTYKADSCNNHCVLLFLPGPWKGIELDLGLELHRKICLCISAVYSFVFTVI